MIFDRAHLIISRRECMELSRAVEWYVIVREHFITQQYLSVLCR